MLDSHCHILDAPNFSHQDFFLKLHQYNVSKIYCNTIGADQWQALSILSKKHTMVTPFYGIHPWHINETTVQSSLELLASYLDDEHSSCGEIGLDRLCSIDFHLQEDVFRRQLDIAFRTKSFVAIHCVKAWGKMLEIIEGYQGEISFMIHSFHGSKEVMERLVALGGMISFSDHILHPHHRKINDVVKATPLSNLLLETDFPYHKSLNGSSDSIYHHVISDLYAFVSDLHQISVAELENIVEKNGSICTY